VSTAKVDGSKCRIALPQDPGSAGKVQAQDLIKALAGFTARARTASGSKVTRAEPFAAQCEAGNVDILVGPWNDEFLDEITMFPGGRRKDIPDAAAEAFNDLARRDNVVPFVAPRSIGKD